MLRKPKSVTITLTYSMEIYKPRSQMHPDIKHLGEHFTNFSYLTI